MDNFAGIAQGPLCFRWQLFEKPCKVGDQHIAPAFVFFLFFPERRRVGQVHQGIPAWTDEIARQSTRL